MYKRPTMRKKIVETDPLVRERYWKFHDAAMKTLQETYRPVYNPEFYIGSLERHGQMTDTLFNLVQNSKNSVPDQKKEPPPKRCTENLANLFERISSRPDIKTLVEAMRRDGYPEQKVIAAKNHYAWLRKSDEKRQAELEKAFVKYKVKTVAAPKKILKVVKKKT
jgi:hypothetical protein